MDDQAVRRWATVVAAAVLLGLAALLANLTSTDQMSGNADGLAAARKSVSKLVNAGAVWAGLSVFAGWQVRGIAPALGAGLVAPLVALVTHYGLADVFGLMPWAGLADNASWFVAAAVLGPPLGVVGALATRVDVLGLVAGLVVPAGAVVEGFVHASIPPASLEIWSNRVAGVVAGVTLIVGGVIMAFVHVRRRMQRGPAELYEGSFR